MALSHMREGRHRVPVGLECNSELAEEDPPAGWEVGKGESKNEQQAGSRKRGPLSSVLIPWIMDSGFRVQVW